MVLAPLSRLLLCEAGGLGGDITGSRLSLSDLGSDSSQESSTLELPSGETLETLVSLPVSRCWELLVSSCRESFVFRGYAGADLVFPSHCSQFKCFEIEIKTGADGDSIQFILSVFCSSSGESLAQH